MTELYQNKKDKCRKIVLALLLLMAIHTAFAQQWSSELVWVNEQGQLEYAPDEKGGVIPDFSAVGYRFGEESIPYVEVVVTAEPVEGDDRSNLQQKINEVARLPLNENGFRGALLLTKGEYQVKGTLTIPKSGIIIRGEGNSNDATVITETATSQTDLFYFKGSGSRVNNESTKVAIAEDFVPVGRKYFELEDASGFSVGDQVVVFRPGTDNWIHDLKMDQIAEKDGLVQWTGNDYNLYFERIITKIEGNMVYFKNPVVMEMDANYGGGFLMKCHFEGRINNCGIEKLFMKSTYTSETDESHGWNAVKFSAAEHCWARDITGLYFGYCTVNIGGSSKNITVLDATNMNPKSKIEGGRRYSFNCDGQLNLFQNCYSNNGRHDYVTGARVCGPNVFTRCAARNTHNDIGPHHRWACGTLFDLINTSGEINVQDRGDWGTGHGWAGVTQVLWNCKVGGACVQSPYVSGKNYSIGTLGNKLQGRLLGRPAGVWEGQNKVGLNPESLYEAQLSNRMGYKVGTSELPQGNLKLYPNPCNDRLRIDSAIERMSFQFITTNGEKIHNGTLACGENSIDTSMLKQGFYILQMTSDNYLHQQKVRIQR